MRSRELQDRNHTRPGRGVRYEVTAPLDENRPENPEAIRDGIEVATTVQPAVLEARNLHDAVRRPRKSNVEEHLDLEPVTPLLQLLGGPHGLKGCRIAAEIEARNLHDAVRRPRKSNVEEHLDLEPVTPLLQLLGGPHGLKGCRIAAVVQTERREAAPPERVEAIVGVCVARAVEIGRAS